MANITIQKTTAGALFHITGVDGVTRPYPVNTYEFKPSGDGIHWGLVGIYQLDYIVQNQRFDQTINGDTGLAFADLASVQTYIETYFFRKAGGSSGSLSASNFITGEIPTGTIDGTNKVFILANTPTQFLGAYKNGIRLAPDEYAVSTNQITYTVAPTTVGGTDKLLNDYIK